jgi:hypothetical protein
MSERSEAASCRPRRSLRSLNGGPYPRAGRSERDK